MKTSLTRIFGVAAVLLSCSMAQASPYSAIFGFGDSNSDTGRRLALEGIPGDPYYLGRHSNGQVALEVMAGLAGLGGGGAFTNYSVGGALTGTGNVDASPLVANTGLLGQFATFQSTHPTASSSALYFIWGGDNDINGCMGATRDLCSTAQVNAVIANIDALINDLAGLGARHFMVIGSYGGGADKAEFRSGLAANLASLDAGMPDADILYFNARQSLLTMTDAANPYGFTHTSSADPCYTGDFFTGTPGALCADPASYVFWDTRGHLTGHAHEILGTAMAAALPPDSSSVPEPGSIVLLVSGLAGLSLRRRTNRRIGEQEKPSDPLAGTGALA